MIPCPVCGALMPERKHGQSTNHCSRSCGRRSVVNIARHAEARRLRALANAEARRLRIIANHDVDDVVVTRLMAGVPVTSTRSERIEAVAYLTMRGRSAVWIAAQLHITTRSVCRYRAELNQSATTRKVA